jgi:hypothetical protein
MLLPVIPGIHNILSLYKNLINKVFFIYNKYTTNIHETLL